MFSPTTMYGFAAKAKLLSRSVPRWPLVINSSMDQSQQESASSVGGVRFRSNRSRRGLYDGKDIGTGNNVSFSMRATKRKFKPNVFKKRVYRLVKCNLRVFHFLMVLPLPTIPYTLPFALLHLSKNSETLDEMVRFHLTTSALRSIDKAGGLDNYLLTSKHVTSGEGLEVKDRILEKMKLNEELLAAAASSTDLDGNNNDSETETNPSSSL